MNVDKVATSEEFSMELYYRDGFNEIISSANHLVNVTVVHANNLDQVLGTLENSSFNLQSGQRTITQLCNTVGLLRIKVEDELVQEVIPSVIYEQKEKTYSTFNGFTHIPLGLYCSKPKPKPKKPMKKKIANTYSSFTDGRSSSSSSGGGGSIMDRIFGKKKSMDEGKIEV